MIHDNVQYSFKSFCIHINLYFIYKYYELIYHMYKLSKVKLILYIRINFGQSYRSMIKLIDFYSQED